MKGPSEKGDLFAVLEYMKGETLVHIAFYGEFHSCILGDKRTLRNKLGRGVNRLHYRQPKGNTALLECLNQPPLPVLAQFLVQVLVPVLVQFLDTHCC